MQIDQLPNRYSSIAAIAQNLQTTEKEKGCTAAGMPQRSFEELLQDVISQNKEPTFSKHADARMMQREISLSSEDMTKLTGAISMAKNKGVKNTLVLMDQMAFIVNVPDNVVITAMNGQDLRENVFTQIDGAVIV